VQNSQANPGSSTGANTGALTGQDRTPQDPGLETGRESVTVRFAGDSGDGIQLTGSQFTNSTALAGQDLSTFPDFPAEIRAPVGTTFGVSAFQINFGAREIFTPGDQPDVLVALNPAALKVNLDVLPPGGLIVVDEATFGERNLKKAGFETNPLEDKTLAPYRVLRIDISKQTLEAVEAFGLGKRDALRCKNMWSLGLMLWMFERDRDPIVEWVVNKFSKNPTIKDANLAALNAGHAYGETAELSAHIGRFQIGKASLEPGEYRTIIGSDALAWGLVAGSQFAELPLVFCSYPITPASSLLHALAQMKEFGVVTFQAEDEIAAACAAIGVSYGGALGVTSSSGPGIALKGEAIGLAIATELPLVVVNSQRGGPSTGLPTKTEQSDLYQAVYGRNADAPLPVIAARSPGESFYCAIEAVRLATKYMTPVMLLSDGFIANAAEPWKLPDLDQLPRFPVKHAEAAPPDGEKFNPFARNPDTLARVWAKPGTPGLEHRIGGIEKAYDSGDISYDPANHQKMTRTRWDKIAGIAKDIPPQAVDFGPDHGGLAIVGWGSSYGPIARAVRVARASGISVSHIHIRHINPFPDNLEALLERFDRILVPEMNMGQLATLLRDRFNLNVIQLNKVMGQPFKVAEIETAINENLLTRAAE